MKHIRALAENYIRKHEGQVLFPYKDSRGILTIGVGHNLTHGISQAASDFIFKEDVDKAEESLKKNLPDIYNSLDANRQLVLLDVCFNLGIGGLLKFKNMLAALRKNDYALAADELLNSAYAKQVPQRAKENAEILRTGEFGA